MQVTTSDERRRREGERVRREGGGEEREEGRMRGRERERRRREGRVQLMEITTVNFQLIFYIVYNTGSCICLYHCDGVLWQ